MEAENFGQIVILNGAPRSGKSSIAKAIQATFAGFWMNLGVDVLMSATPAQFQPGIGLRPGGECPDLERMIPVMYCALYESIAAHSRLGLNVVVDVGHHDSYSVPLDILPQCARILSGLPVLFIGVHCSIEAIMERRRRTGYNAPDSANEPIPPPVLRWQTEVHKHGIYDLEIDTSLLTPMEYMPLIRRTLENPPAPSAFQRLQQDNLSMEI